MGKLRMQVPFGLETSRLFNFLPSSGIPRELLRKAASLGLSRCAGNTFICESSKDFWQIRGNKIVRLVGDEVDNGDHLPAAPEDNPAGFMDEILGDLTF
jgi:hypothetical protein